MNGSTLYTAPSTQLYWLSRKFILTSAVPEQSLETYVFIENMPSAESVTQNMVMEWLAPNFNAVLFEQSPFKSLASTAGGIDAIVHGVEHELSLKKLTYATVVLFSDDDHGSSACVLCANTTSVMMTSHTQQRMLADET